MYFSPLQVKRWIRPAQVCFPSKYPVTPEVKDCAFRDPQSPVPLMYLSTEVFLGTINMYFVYYKHQYLYRTKKIPVEGKNLGSGLATVRYLTWRRQIRLHTTHKRSQ